MANGVRTRTDFDVVDHHRQRTRRAEARAQAYEAENRRSQRLLTLALLALSNNGREHDPLVLLDVLCRIDGTNPARPAWIEEKAREDVYDAEMAAGERFLKLIAAGRRALA